MNDIEIIEAFEATIAEYAGAKYGVAVSSGTNAIFLCLQLLKYEYGLRDYDVITIPKRTYISVPCSIKNCKLEIKFDDIEWSGLYQLKPTDIWDSTVRFRKGMYLSDDVLQCLSFQYRKHLPIGRGGMILTDSKNDMEWLKQARHDGKHPGISKWEDKLEIAGWSMYMLPEQCARGLTLFNAIKDKDLPDCACWKDYPDVSKQKIFQ